MEGNTITVTVRQLDEVKPSQSGTPQRGVLTEQGWIKIRGNAVASLAVGNQIVISEPSEFKNKKYSELKSITGSAPEAPKAPAAGAPAAPPASSSAPAYKPSCNSGAIKLDDYIRAIKNMHGLAGSLEPDILVPVETKEDGSKIMGVSVDRSRARASLINTFSIALTKGNIDMSEPKREPGSDDIPPWEKK